MVFLPCYLLLLALSLSAFSMVDDRNAVVLFHADFLEQVDFDLIENNVGRWRS
jgi:hypothetical protein